jgi:hypothetical protein
MDTLLTKKLNLQRNQLLGSYITQQLKHFQRNTILPDRWTLVMFLMNQIIGNCSLTKERIKKTPVCWGERIGERRDTKYRL